MNEDTQAQVGALAARVLQCESRLTAVEEFAAQHDGPDGGVALPRKRNQKKGK